MYNDARTVNATSFSKMVSLIYPGLQVSEMIGSEYIMKNFEP